MCECVCRDSSWKALQEFWSALVLRKSRTSVAACRTSSVFIVCFHCVSLELPSLQLTTVSGRRHWFLWGRTFFSTDKSIWLISFPCCPLIQALRTGHWRWFHSLGRGKAWVGKLALFLGKRRVQDTSIGRRGRVWQESLVQQEMLASHSRVLVLEPDWVMLPISVIRAPLELLHEDLTSATCHSSCCSGWRKYWDCKVNSSQTRTGR